MSETPQVRPARYLPLLASLLFVGACEAREGSMAYDRGIVRAYVAECLAKGGLWAGSGGLDFDGPCVAIDSIIPLTGERP